MVGEPKRSVLLITLDTTRFDRLGCYGGSGGLTPFLDGFSNESFLFERCETPVPLTLPAHTAILSGLYPQRTNVQVNVAGSVPEEVPLIAEALKSNGYSTAAFVSSAVLLSKYGLNRGFETYDQSFFDPVKEGFQRSSAEDTLSRAESWIRKRNTPFFCWIHLFDPHYPYKPPEPWATKYKSRPYDGSIAYMDSALMDFFRKPAVAGWKDWCVVICGDHGESLGEHGEMRHGVMIYESTTRVPMMIHSPGQNSPRKITDWVSLIDIAPTLKDIIGVPVKDMDGISLKPLLSGESLAGERKLFLGSLEGTMTYGWAPLFGVVEDGMKMIQAPRPERYDLARDHAEISNLMGKDKKLEDRLREHIKDYILIKPVGESGTVESASAAEMEHLAGLGYIQPGFSATGAYSKDPKDFISLEDKFMALAHALGINDLTTADRILKEIEKKDPHNPLMFYFKGKLWETRSFKEACSAYVEAVSLNPSAFFAWSMLVKIHLNEGETRKAAEIARRALGVCKDELGYFNLALAEEGFLKGRQATEIRKYIDNAIQASPSFARAYMVSFELNVRERLKDRAEADINNVRKYGKNSEIMSWRKDPVFKNFFDSAPKDLPAGPELPRIDTHISQY